MKVSRALALVVSGWLILLLNYPSGRAEAATRLVNANTGNNVGNCLVSPCKTITYAVGQASSHDLIDVSWGTYDAALGESVPLNISMSLTLQGAGASVTTVAGIRVQGGAVDIRGFKIEGGVYYQGGPGTIDHNEIVNSQGDGIYCNQAAVTIHNNLIRGHKEYGIRNYAENNSIFNNTIVENGWGGYGGGVAALMSSPIVRNNIIVANIGYGIETNNFIPYTENDYNDVWNNSLGNYHSMVTPGPHSRSADPLFVSPSDLHPQCGPLSPVINTGDNSEVGSITADLTGNPRIVGDVVDMGAYEAVCNRFVADSGSDSGFCLESWAPCRTIGYAVSQALAGDTVSVAAGLYDQALGESFPILINKKIYLSGFGARFTTVDAGGSNHVFSVSNSAPLIAGFRIRGGWNGILLENGGSATITRNILRERMAWASEPEFQSQDHQQHPVGQRVERYRYKRDGPRGPHQQHYRRQFLSRYPYRAGLRGCYL